MKKKTIQFITLGCSKNLVDTEKLLGQLSADRFDVVPEGEGMADMVVVNTCGFIQDAKEESINTILEVLEARKQGMVREVIVTGCLSERFRDELKQEIPEVDAWFGVHDQGDLFDYLQEHYHDDSPERFITTPGHYAYLKIAEGCDRSCSFCVIPMIRGPYVSRPVDQLVDEATRLARKGVKELILVAQDLTYYGQDLEKKPMLASLLKELVKVDGIEWIRLHYAYPNRFPEEVLQLMVAEPKICNYLDIPLQHINDLVLQSMRRGHGKKQVLDFMHKLRQQYPEVAIRTTMMVGFPGETDAAFQELMDFINEIRFERLGVFTYSPEEDTTALTMGNTVAEKVKQQRADAIMNRQSEISESLNQAKSGKSYRVIVDREEQDYFVGRTEYDSPEVDNEVFIEKAPDIQPGRFVQVTILHAGEHELYATVQDGSASSPIE